MVGSDSTTVVASRSKREDRESIKHGTQFSQWKILVGPCDWEEYLLGKDGAERYRVHNLPGISTPGIYELAICVPETGLGRNIAKRHPERMVVVYLGHSENVRTRLQHYGRTGAHLGSGCSTAYPTLCSPTGPGFFDDIFSKGGSIMFRWAPMPSKSDAHEIETRLLKKYDYPWNKSTNGSRRPNDISEKLNHFPAIDRMLLSGSQVGIRIKASKWLAIENNFNACADEESPSILSRVFKFGRSLPRSVLGTSGITQGNNVICGVALTHDSICTREPLEGRKRCAEHKGLKINELTTGRISNSSSIYGSKYGVIYSSKSDGHVVAGFRHGTVTVKSFGPICGFTLIDGSPCRRQAVQGNKRCDEHKGRRIGESNSRLVSTEEKPLYTPHVFKLNSGDKYQVLSSRVNQNKNGRGVVECGAITKNGTACKGKPVEGNKRCWQHRGMRAGGDTSEYYNNSAAIGNHGRLKYEVSSSRIYQNKNGIGVFTCGATTKKGTACQRKPEEGNRRCWQHRV